MSGDAIDLEKTAKIVLLGDSGVGKSALLIRYTESKFELDMRSTIGIDFRRKVVIQDGYKYTLTVWDTAGQEKFRSIGRGYYRGSQGLLLLYDVTEENTFLQIRKWIRDINRHTGGDPPKIYLLANKCDMAAERVISREKGESMAEEYNCPHFEISCKTGAGVETAFQKVQGDILSVLKESAGAVKKGVIDTKNRGSDGGTVKKKCC